MFGEPEGKSPQGRQRCRWLTNIKINLRDKEWRGMDWIELAQDMDQLSALLNVVMNFQVPQNVRKFLSSYTTGGP
jgi:hypothetical protein